jgi:hypothetical protein
MAATKMARILRNMRENDSRTAAENQEETLATDWHGFSRIRRREI